MQFGASASLYAAACGFSIEGNVGFDVLIQLWPPHFLAEFRASVQLKRGSTNLFKVSVEAALEGPFPLRVSRQGDVRDPVVGLLGQLRPHADRRRRPRTRSRSSMRWRSSSPRSRTRGAGGPRRPTRRPSSSRVRRDDRPDQILLHPMGTLAVQQGVVPLNLQRDIDRIGDAAPGGARGSQ